MTSRHVQGTIWRFGDDVDTDMIIPARYLARPEPEDWARHVMEPLDPDFPRRIGDGGIIVAGENFGSGSSREHAAIALKVAGVRAVIARSFSTIFHRNAVNNGLPVVEYPDSLSDIKSGDEVEIDLEVGTITNRRTGQTYDFEPLPEFLLELLLAGGLVSYYEGQKAGQE